MEMDRAILALGVAPIVLITRPVAAGHRASRQVDGMAVAAVARDIFDTKALNRLGEVPCQQAIGGRQGICDGVGNTRRLNLAVETHHRADPVSIT